MIGTTLGHYRIEEKIGAGGMGEVYRATDTKLGREVAIKVLPEAFAADPERLARFDQEARLLASLNHPHIAAIYGLEEAVPVDPSGGAPAGDRPAGAQSSSEPAGPVRYLVLELVPGETLAERIDHGPLPVDEALQVCRQIAEALEAAHERGIIHRDLKPANVKVTPEGKVKVLDFGLAKAFETDAAAGTDLSQSPTASFRGSRDGVILGTAAYMSPEQARGKPLDKRTDIWSFGCVLYEVLTGRKAFHGETASDTIAKILEREPNWQALPANTPARVRDLFRRCLQKDLGFRLRDIGDARIEIHEALTRPQEFANGETPRWRWTRWERLIAWALVAVAVCAAGLVIWTAGPGVTAPPPLGRFVIDLPADPGLWIGDFNPVAISSDGANVVFVAGSGEDRRLYLRPRDSLEAEAIPGTDGGYKPFLSPDGQWIGFFAGNTLKTVPIAGGAPVVLAEVTQHGCGASWGPDGTIVFSPDWGSALYRVPGSGGKPRAVTSLNVEEKEGAHIWPQILPGGKTALFTVWTGADYDEARIAVVSLDTGERKTVVEGGSDARYVPGGYLVYLRSGELVAQRFDLARLEAVGQPVPVLQGMMSSGVYAGAYYAVSDDGTLVYVPGSVRFQNRTLVWTNREGDTQALTQTPEPLSSVRLSPDGRRLAVSIMGAVFHVWIYDLTSGARTRMTFEGDSSSPIWTPDGRRVTFSWNQGGLYELYWMPADGSAPAQRLLTAPGSWPQATAWSPDGKYLAFTQIEPGSGTGNDIWLFAQEEGQARRPLIRTRFNEWGAKFSPDGRWLAYTSDESGRSEVYLQAFPGPGGKRQISPDGGTEPQWSADGRELFYRSGDRMMAVPVSTGPTFSSGTPSVLFRGRFSTHLEAGPHSYDVTPDGQQFVMIRESEQPSSPAGLVVVTNWFEDLKRRVPAGNN